MKKLILIKENQVPISQEEIACYCDFCGGNPGRMSFISSFEDETQICFDCVIQLNKLIK